MIQVFELTKSFTGKMLFEDISFSLNKNEIVGLVGRNGAGKSTLMKIVCGTETVDEGRIDMPSGYKMGYLDQHIHFTKKTVLEECCQVLSEDEQYDFYKAEIILFGLGFTKEDLHLDPHTFSGGYQLRINLTKTLLQNPDLLLLDEPTNYLDILSLRWLRNFLKNFSGEVIIITHDRSFMDSVSTHTMGITRGKMIKLKGDSSKYYEQISVNETIQEQTRVKQEKRVKDLKKFVDKFGAKASKASQAQSKQKQIDRIKILDKVGAEQKAGFRFNYESTNAKVLLEVRELKFSYSGVDDENLFKDLFFSIEAHDRLAIIGKNGKGKTTLLNVLAGKNKETGGVVSYNPTATVGYYEQTNRKELNPNKTIAEEVQSANYDLTYTRSRAICGAMMFGGDDAEKKISVLSGGEQSRVLFGKVLAKPANLLFLDEPSNHLDMETIEAMIEELHSFKGAVALVTHNEEMLRELATKLIVFRQGGAEFFNGTYDEFLEKIGWDEEEDDAPKKKADKKSAHVEHVKKKELSKKEAQHLKKLKKEHAKLEGDIIALEEEVKSLTLEVQAKSSQGVPHGELQEIYDTITANQTTIDTSYEKMETVFAKIDKLEKRAG